MQGQSSGTQRSWTLRGAATSREPLSLVYVRNIEIDDDDNDDSITKGVRGYCHDKGVRVVRVRIIYNRFNDYIVGCKLAVPASHKDKVTATGFWPEGVISREW